MRDKILYISPVWTNLGKYSLLENMASGMPAFTEPLKYFLEAGIDIDLLWIEDGSSPELKDPFLASQKKIFVNTSSRIGLIKSFLKVFVSTVFEIKNTKAKVIYCHGALSAGAILASVLLGKRTFVRVYGTNKYAKELERLGRLKFFFKYPFVYMIFALPSDVLIATDDGSRADIIFDKIGHSRSFHLLKNGLPENNQINNTTNSFFLCVGRIERKKNQILAVDFFNEVARGLDGVELLFIGKVSDKSYFSQLQTVINNSEFRSRINVIDSLNREELDMYYRDCEAVLSFQEDSNFGNVAIECMSCGCLLVTFREKIFIDLSLSRGGPAAILGKTVPELARVYSALSSDEKQNIRVTGRASIMAELNPWVDRAAKELDIIMGVEDA